ncbi:hypothetical protein HPB47_021788 [Ixodes persulcatus]|uniref:Uncharacterized protein n=1 Tax=Ixodes persulcatus TaxID=34615 RepID=A0AC60QBJ9_IXOPE|nr:hypothetical protein HPB47_021788 [Ixodes persulcatus]
MTSTVLPVKGMCFSFSVPADTAVDEIMDAFQVTAGSGGLKFLQHQGGTRFMSSVTSIGAANRLVAQGNLVLRDVAVPLEAVGVHVLHVSIYRLPPYVTEEAVVQAIAPFGKVKSITYVSYRDRPDILTGTRVVKVEMTKPIPNFITIQGHRVMVDYRGLRRVCSRCGQEGHIGPACKTARCERCAVFGHPTAGCTAPCLRCGHAHATADCTQRRSYAAVAHPAGAPRPHQPSQGAAGQSRPDSEELNDNFDPSIRPRDRPLAPSVTPSGDSSNEFSSVTSTAVKSPDVFSMETPVQATVKTPVAAATPPIVPEQVAAMTLPIVTAQVTAATPPTVPAQVTAATPTIAPAQVAVAALPVASTQDDAAPSPDALDSQESDVADSSHSPGRLVISDDTDLTPGQRDPSTRSDMSPSTQRESSKFSSSDEGEDRAADRGDAKRTFPCTSSGSDGPIASTVKKKRSEPHDSDEDYSLTF